MAVSVFNKLAKMYQEKFMDVNLYSETFDFFCDQIKKENAEILEIACGPGNITKYLLDKRPDFKITGIDLSSNMIDLAKINNPKAEFQLMDCRDLGMISKKYDAIMCGFCLPYLNKMEVRKLTEDASKIIKPNGLLYFSTMEDDYNKSGYKKGSTGDDIYMHYYQADFLTAMLTESDFRIIYLTRKDFPLQDGIKTIDLILVAEREP